VTLAHKLEAWANDHGHSLVELAVAWTLATPGVTNTLIGAKRPDQVQAIAGAAHWTLSDSDRAELDDIIATLPESAWDAKMIVWDHFDPAALEGLRRRRHDQPASAKARGTREEGT
jgi:diketogulonate reductase-like aldo/keto reductase